MTTILNNLTNKTARRSTSGRASITKRMLLLSSLVSSLAFSAQAQQETSYLYEKNSMKHYATSQNVRTGEYAMAGTIFDIDGIAGNNGIHLLLESNPFKKSVVYNLRDADERLVGLHYPDVEQLYMVTTLAEFDGRNHVNGIQIIQHPSCDRQRIYAPAGTEYWPMGTLMNEEAKMLYICGYVTPTQGPGTHPDYTTSKQAFVMSYDLGSNSVANVQVYNWTLTSPMRRDYDMAHRMKFMKDGSIWVGGLCNGAKGSAMMNMLIDPNTLNAIDDHPLNPGLAKEDHPVASFDISENLNEKGYSYVFGTYFYSESSRIGMNPKPSNYSITALDARTLQPVPGSKSHAYFSSFENAWGTNIVSGYERETVILSGFQDNEKCSSPIPSTRDNINPFLTEMVLEANGSGDIMITHKQWSTILSREGTGTSPDGYMDLGGGKSNLVFGPITTVRDNSGKTDNIVLNAPIWNKFMGSELNIKYIEVNKKLDPKCEISKCDAHYDLYEVKLSEKVSDRPFIADTKGIDVCPIDYKPEIYDCAKDSYFKGANPANVLEVGGNASVLVANVYPNPAHDMVQVKLSGAIDATAAVTVQLTDLTGKQLSVLYKGTASGMNASLQLPGQLPNGIYTVTVTYNGAKLQSVPLVIN